ncbi:hypothetical protein [Parageobacillus thermoglucosidasius]|uniref:Uncharacterized protein n=1 Tax=Parageobacillus thermoglucosidasius TaxID=1426 RepID=A0A1B7KWX7_PARTM|nr:hypothetical protein [Parageobacillus thermoglucosidasius]OAT74566.1 hypothetical protein A7K69_02325 [Parageobacillus thermoglucosidasius]
MPIIDVRAHGGVFGGGKYRKGSKISAGVITPPNVPLYAISNFTLYTYTSSTLSVSYDPYEDVIIGTNFNSSSNSIITRCKPSDLKSIASTTVYSDNSGNNPSVHLANVPIYLSSANKYYATYARYPDGYTEIRVFNASTGSQIKTISYTGIDVVLSRTADYVIYYNAYNKKIHKLNFADDSVTVVTDLNSYVSPSVVKVHGWDKLIITDGSQSRLFNYDGTYTGTTIPVANIPTPAFYHQPSNTIIGLKYYYGSSGGHYMEKYNPTNFSLIASYKLTNRNQVTSSGWGTNVYYDSAMKVLLAVLYDNGSYYVYAFPIADDGTIVGWNYGDTTGNNLSKYGYVKGGAYSNIVTDGIVCMVDQQPSDYYIELQSLKTYFTIGG